MREEDAQSIQFTSLGLAGDKGITVFVDPFHFLWIFLSINKICLHTANGRPFMINMVLPVLKI